jgi:hypothetical protein
VIVNASVRLARNSLRNEPAEFGSVLNSAALAKLAGASLWLKARRFAQEASHEEANDGGAGNDRRQLYKSSA